jgi:HNH endonuclease/NUMOD4 motif
MSEPDDELWRPIAGYEGRYWVSTYGRVTSFFGSAPSGPVRKTTCEDGTDRLYLTRHGERTNHNVRDLVLATFVGPKPAGFIVRHRDGNRANCRLENLFYGPK